ncbi:hypothetical protein SDC9_91836 [bioreactor metagenome]|uniref:Uncharacterized protein n=1 Tax=bioreactor metagenome TaxID=1076179 RepID=A0A644ZVZ8_9ZZZZ
MLADPFGKGRAIHASNAMEIPCFDAFPEQRLVSSFVDWAGCSHRLHDVQGILQCLFKAYIACCCDDSLYVQLFQSCGKQQGDSIIQSGVHIQYDSVHLIPLWQYDVQGDCHHGGNDYR